jgi:hypothetical protein
MPLGSSTGIGSNIKVYKNSSLLSENTDYNISYDSTANEVLVNFNALDSYTQYSIEVYPGLSGINGSSSEKLYQFSFSTLL